MKSDTTLWKKKGGRAVTLKQTRLQGEIQVGMSANASSNRVLATKQSVYRLINSS